MAQRPTTPNDGVGYIAKGTFNAPLTESSTLRVNASYGSQEPVAANSPAPGILAVSALRDAEIRFFDVEARELRFTAQQLIFINRHQRKQL